MLHEKSSNITHSGMVSNGGREGTKEKDGRMEISAEQETRPCSYFHLPFAPGRLPCPIGAGEEPIAPASRWEGS